MKCDVCFKNGLMVEVRDECIEGFINVCKTCCDECEHKSNCVVFGGGLEG